MRWQIVWNDPNGKERWFSESDYALAHDIAIGMSAHRQGVSALDGETRETLLCCDDDRKDSHQRRA